MGHVVFLPFGLFYGGCYWWPMPLSFQPSSLHPASSDIGGGTGEHLSHRLLVYFESSLVMVFLLEALEHSGLHRLAWVVGAGF